jgi:hypothetical protein
MRNRVIMASATNVADKAADRANEQLEKLQNEEPRWKVVETVTNVTIFDIQKDPYQMPPIHHANYTVTITLQLEE